MSTMDTDTTKEEKIESLLYLIAACEVSLRQFPDDLKFRLTMEKAQKQRIAELREVIYGS